MNKVRKGWSRSDPPDAKKSAAPMSLMGQQRPKLLLLPAAKNTTERMGNIVPKEDLPMLTQKTVPEPKWLPSTYLATIGPERKRYLLGLDPLGGF